LASSEGVKRLRILVTNLFRVSDIV